MKSKFTITLVHRIGLRTQIKLTPSAPEIPPQSELNLFWYIADTTLLVF